MVLKIHYEIEELKDGDLWHAVGHESDDLQDAREWLDRFMAEYPGRVFRLVKVTVSEARAEVLPA